MNENNPPPELHTTPAPAHQETPSPRTPKQTKHRRLAFRRTFLGLATGFALFLLYYLLSQLAIGHYVFLLPLVSFGIPVIGILIALLTPHKHFGLGLFAGFAIPFVVMFIYGAYLLADYLNWPN
ncbi:MULTISPECIES: hypothetical protein [Micrococcaceae]|uniref:AI-2E family transporter n=1 Tax=Pseudoglutamicibacter albus TaxID=98671 RepID=A0ABU1YXG9_9MICC|nr:MULTISPECIES: hypothetical protein [Micrococcaceae]MCG7303921.1 hypothetical protein [Pseudoglutamicibacter albus]MDR7292928.1 hypothetical protein [Pseudoglutamicibacter albus]OFT23901.1 hypothetical protein HMPREF3175_02895 [Arthrobacter sp. HMSC08H08]OFT41030.1 hypothetical protein HMPREF3160_08670 [Arthrobacter sp. HMSC06H05]